MQGYWAALFTRDAEVRLRAVSATLKAGLSPGRGCGVYQSRVGLQLSLSVGGMQEGMTSACLTTLSLWAALSISRPELQQRDPFHPWSLLLWKWLHPGRVCRSCMARQGKATSMSAPAHVCYHAVLVWSDVCDIHEHILLITSTACRRLTHEACCCRSSACWHQYFRSCSCRSLVMA